MLLQPRRFEKFTPGAETIPARKLNALVAGLTEVFNAPKRRQAWSPDYEDPALSGDDYPFKIQASWESSAVKVQIRGAIFTPSEGYGNTAACAVAFAGTISETGRHLLKLRIVYTRTPFPNPDETETDEFECNDARSVQAELKLKYNKLVECIRRLTPFNRSSTEIICIKSGESGIPELSKNQMYTLVNIGYIDVDIAKRTLKISQGAFDLRSQLLVPPCIYPTLPNGSTET